MSEQTKKVEQIEQDDKASELAEQDLDEVAGGNQEHIGGIDIVVKKKGHRLRACSAGMYSATA